MFTGSLITQYNTHYILLWSRLQKSTDQYNIIALRQYVGAGCLLVLFYLLLEEECAQGFLLLLLLTALLLVEAVHRAT